MAAKYGITGPQQQLLQQPPIYNQQQLGYLNIPPVYDPQMPFPPPPGGFIPWNGQQGQLLSISQPYFQQPGVIENGQIPFQQYPGSQSSGFSSQFQQPLQNHLLNQQQQPLGFQSELNGNNENNDQIKPENEDEENIDPSLYNSDEITNIFQEYTKNSEFIDVENDGLFGHSTFNKKDSALALFYLNLLKESSTILSIQNKPSNKFTKLLENNQETKLENYYRHESINLIEFLKRINKILPNKKIIWLMIEKFFTGFSMPFLPILDENEFTNNLSRIIGEKELTDVKPKLNVESSNDDDLVNLFYLIVIIRLSQLSLMVTTNLDKNNSYLLKYSQNSGEYDLLIDVLFSILQNFKLSKLSKLKIILFKEVLSLVNLNEKSETFNSALLAVELNLNNKYETRSDDILNQTWFLTYFTYYYTHLKKGFPLLFTKESHNLDSVFKEGGASEDFTLQIKMNEVLVRLFNRIYDYSSDAGIPINNIARWIKELNEIKEISFDSFKNENYSTFSKKIIKTSMLIFGKFVNLNIFNYLLIHYENKLSKSKFQEALKESISFARDSVDVTFDILKNYSTYFHSGNEFLLFPQILMLLDKVLAFLHGLFIRSYIAGNPLLSALKTIINIVEELEGFPSLKNYFMFWKITSRSKLFLHLFKKEQSGKLSLLKHSFTLNDSKIKFEEIQSNFHTFTDDEFDQFEKNLDAINEKFDDSKYFKLRSVEAFFSKLDCEEPEFNISLFQ